MIGADYTFARTNVMTFGITTSLDLTRTTQQLSSESITSANPTGVPDNPTGYRMTTTLKSKNHWSVGIAPGYVVNKNLLGYVTLSYHQMRADITTTSSVASGVDAGRILNNPSSGASFSGIGLGLGGKYLLDKSWFFESNLEWVKYRPETVLAPSLTSAVDEITVTQTQSIKPSTLSFKVMLGYKF